MSDCSTAEGRSGIGTLSQWLAACLLATTALVGSLVMADDDRHRDSAEFKIDKAEWKQDDQELRVEGKGQRNALVTLSNAGGGAQLGTDEVNDDDKWKIRLRNPASVPCRVRASQSDGQQAERDVKDAPADCDDGNGGGNGGGGGGTGALGALTVIGANDLGMHCADLDYQIFSILPPFNVVHAQVIEKAGTPRIVGNTEIDLTYQATSSPLDPAAPDSINTTSENLPGLFKTNFWDLTAGGSTFGTATYGSLYPGVQVIGLLGGPDLTGLCADPVNLAGCPSALTLFDPIAVNTGLPVPDPAALFPANPGDPPLLVTAQQHMPGLANSPQPFDRYDTDLPFFVDFPFGFRAASVNWFAADGIPILPVDDAGRSNAYPLMKVAARDKVSGAVKASLDIVLPVASEADCQNCHVQALDCAPLGFDCIGAAVEQTPFDVFTLDDSPPGQTELEKLLNTAKINVLRLHDAKYGDTYVNWDSGKNLVARPCDAGADPADPDCLANQTPVQCSQCHYTPALDLAQAGPVDEPEQGVKGRQQLNHISMSRAMHGVHGSLPDFDAGNGPAPLFPAMPPPNDPLRLAGGTAINNLERDILEQTCYQCHPGKRTQCLRGAMFAGGVVCQDCHGDMQQVGNDFTLKVSSSNPGDFVLDGSLRVPWASEPGCQSCHTGDALNPNHPAGALVAGDGLRLYQAYSTEHLAVPGVAEPVKVAAIIKSPGSRFAENQAVNSGGDNVDVLYRLSQGHGGVMCEGCHNSTHAVWPNQNPFANDNIAANQLQGHSGTLAECDTCHTGDLGNTLAGPHGMHAVGVLGLEFADGGHERLAKDDPDACRACHGTNGDGTVLSRVATNRSFVIEECERGELCPQGEVKNFTVNLARGTEVSCTLCHSNKL